MAIARFSFPQYEIDEEENYWQEEPSRQQDNDEPAEGERINFQERIDQFLEENNLNLSDEEILEIITGAILETQEKGGDND